VPLPAAQGAAPRIVVAGAGYAGLAACLTLRGALEAGQVAVTVVNATDWHLLLPELPLYVAGVEGPEDVRLHLRRALPPRAELHVARIVRLDPRAPAVVCADPPGRIEGDGLLLALGSAPEDYGIPGVAEHAIPIGQWDEARELRARVLEDLHRRRGGSVAVVGGGLTGVEVAAELAERAAEEHARLEVSLVAARILPTMPGPVQRLATAALRRLGVRLVPGRAAAVEAGRVRLQDGGVVAAETIVWAGGVRGHPLVAASGLPVDRRGRALVDRFLRAAPRVYAAGDCAAPTDPDSGRPLAPTAQTALQAGRAAAGNLLRELQGQPPLPFRPRLRGQLVSLGRRQAAGTIGPLVVHGREVAALKRLIERYHAFQLAGVRELARALAGLSGARR
jgi:NADH dehydrogenase